MQTAALNEPNAPPTQTSLGGKLFNVLVSPGEVFEEVVASPTKPANWLVPTLLVCLTGLGLLRIATPSVQSASVVGQLLLVGLATTTGTIWSAFVLWFIGRVFLKTYFQFTKAVEVVALTGVVLALGSVVTVLLVEISGDAKAQPALSLFAGKSSLSLRSLALLHALNLFHLWTAAVLAVGLSRLSGVSFKEAAFWVFGYWVLVRLALILLA